MRELDAIVIHHSASRYKALTWADLKRIHMAERHFSDIGYHFGVVNDTGDWGWVTGRPIEKIGAHCKGFNLASIGVCFEGNYSVDELPAAALETGAIWVGFLCRTYRIPSQRVFPHREVGTTKTECPGLKFPWETFIERVNEQIVRYGARP